MFANKGDGSVDVYAAIVVATPPLRDARRRVGFMPQLEPFTLLAILDESAARDCSVEMLNQRTATGTMWWRRRIHTYECRAHD
jgi:hypothetical protein